MKKYTKEEILACEDLHVEMHNEACRVAKILFGKDAISDQFWPSYISVDITLAYDGGYDVRNDRIEYEWLWMSEEDLLPIRDRLAIEPKEKEAAEAAKKKDELATAKEKKDREQLARLQAKYRLREKYGEKECPGG